MSQIADRERELSEITDKLVESEPLSVYAHVEEIRRFALSQLADLRQLVSANITDTLALKTELSKHVEAIFSSQAVIEALSQGELDTR